MADRRTLSVQITGDIDPSLPRAFDKSGESAERFGERVEKSNRKVHDSSHEAHVGVEQLAQTMRKMFDTTAKIGAVGLAAQGISALGAGGAAAAAGLAPLSGLLAAYPALASTAAQGLGVFKLATAGVSDGLTAMVAGGQEWEKWLKSAQQPQKDFLLGLRPIHDELRSIQQEVQARALPRFADGVHLASRNLKVLRPIASDTAEVLGRLAVRAGAIAGSDIMGRDIARVGANNVRFMQRLGNAGLNVAVALRDVVSEAQPLVGWLTKLAERSTQTGQNFIFAQRQSGNLRKFFEETQRQAGRLIRIGGDLALAFVNIGKAAYPLGNDLLRSLTRTVDKFREWTDSARGQNTIRRYFEQARPAIYEAAKLVRDVGGAFLRLGSGDQVAPLLRTVRTELVPAFEGMFQSTTREFMPAFLTFATEAIKLFTHLAGTSGPLVELTKLLGNAAGALNRILDTFPGLNTAVVSLIALGGIAKALKLAGAITGVSTLLGLLKRTRVAAAEVGAAGAVGGRGRAVAGAAGAGVAGAFGGPAGLALAAGTTVILAGQANRGSREERADASVGRFAQQLGRAARSSSNDYERLRDVIDKVRRGIGLTRAENALWTRSLHASGVTGATAVGRLLDSWDSLRRGSERTRRRVTTDWGRIDDANRESRRQFNLMRTNAQGNMGDIADVVNRNTLRIKDDLGTKTREGKEALAKNFRLAIREVRTQMRNGTVATKDGMAAIRKYLVQELQVYGLSLKQAKEYAGRRASGTPERNELGNAGRAGGGWIGAPGQIGMDTVPAMLAPGEAVLNRHQQAVIEGMLGDGFLDRLFTTVDRPHFMARGGIVPVPGFPGERAASSVIPAIEMIARRFGLVLTDAFGSGHRSPGHTVTGTAADFAGPDRAMDRAVKFLVGRGYLVGYDGRFGSQAWGGHGPSYVAGSNAHLHVELGGGGALAVPTVPRVAIRGGGMIGGAVQRVLDIARGGAQRVLGNAATAAMGTPVTGGGGGGMSKSQIARLWVRAGGDPRQANLMAAIALAESGGRAGIVNSIGATGLWQIHPGGSQYLNPLSNARAAVGKLSSQGLGAWEAYTNGSYRQYLNRGGYARGRRRERNMVANRLAVMRGQARARAPRARPRRQLPTVAWDHNIQAFIDQFEARLAVAGLTDTTADDLEELRTLEAFYTKGLAGARRRGNPQSITEYAQGLGNVRSQIKELTQAPEPTDDPNQPLIDALEAVRVAEEARAEADRQHTEALTAVGNEIKRQTDTAAQMSTSGEYQMRKMFAEWVSGALGRGIVGRSFTPGTGVEVAYAMSIFQIA